MAFTEEQVNNFMSGIKTLMACTKVMYDSAKEAGFDDTQAFILANEYYTKAIGDADKIQEVDHE
jgi:hypothetical protein